nr:ABC transporter substrate-binding protein [Dehalococcoidales bacterium]
QATELKDGLRQRVQAVVAKTKSAAKPRVFYELDATEPSKPFTPGPGSFIDSLIAQAGGINVAADAKMPWAQLSSEEIVKKDPEIVVLGDSKYGVTVEQVKQRAGWGAVTALQKDAVYPIDDDLISRPGPRVVDGLEALAKLIHPELFK